VTSDRQIGLREANGPYEVNGSRSLIEAEDRRGLNWMHFLSKAFRHLFVKVDLSDVHYDLSDVQLAVVERDRFKQKTNDGMRREHVKGTFLHKMNECE